MLRALLCSVLAPAAGGLAPSRLAGVAAWWDVLTVLRDPKALGEG